MNTTDLELIEQLVSNDPGIRENAWKHLYQTYYHKVRDMVLNHAGSEDDAVDVFQDGLMILDYNLRNSTFRNESSLNTYIFSICKNLWFKEYNRKQKEALLQPELILETREHFDYLINVEIVTVLMNELQDDCRKILVEYYYNNRSMAELKEIFNVNSIQAAKNKKWRCLTYLERLFKDKGVTPTWE